MEGAVCALRCVHASYTGMQWFVCEREIIHCDCMHRSPDSHPAAHKPFLTLCVVCSVWLCVGDG